MGRISALTELTSLASNDYLVVLDSSANIAKKITIANAFGVPEATWTATGESWVYASWTSGTRIGTITVPTDATTKYQAGMRIKISQSTGGTKYGIITKVEATLLTVFFPSGTTLNNETISTPYYSSLKVPLGFNPDPTLWRLSVTDSTNRTITDTTTYTTMVVNLPVGIGAWILNYSLTIRVTNSSASAKRGFITLSSDGSTETDTDLTSNLYVPATSGFIHSSTISAYKEVVFTSPKTLLFMGKNSAASSATQMDNSTTLPVILYATCAYL